MSARWNYYIWLIILLQILVPLNISFNTNMNIYSLIQHNQDKYQVESYDGNEYYNDSFNEYNEEKVKNDTNKEADNIISLLFNIWIIGTLSISLCFIITKKTFKKKDLNKVISVKAEKYLSQSKHITKCYKNIKLYVNDKIKSPVVFGTLKPAVFCPTEIFDKFSEKEIVFIFAHELTHIKFKHNFIQSIVLINAVIFWFNPAVWVMFYKMKDDAEIMCDSEVVNKLDNDEKKEYGKLLINAAKLSKTRSFEPSLALLRNKKLLYTRINSLLVSKQNNKTIKIVSILTLVLLFIILATGSNKSTNITRNQVIEQIKYLNESNKNVSTNFYDYGYFIEGIVDVESSVFRIKYIFNDDKLNDIKYYSINKDLNYIDKFKLLFTQYIINDFYTRGINYE